jgi:hypothetical protein
MKRDPTEKESEKIFEAIFANDRVEATNLYISVTECGLTEAQSYIRNLTAELKETSPEKFARKKLGKRNWLPI